MTKHQRNLRLSAQAERQLAELAEKWGTSITETVSITLDRVWQQECNKEAQMGKQLSADRLAELGPVVRDITENGMAADNTDLEIQFEYVASERGWSDEDIKLALKNPWFPWMK